MKQTLRLFFSLLAIWMNAIHAEVYIEINQGIDSVRSIGVTTFRWTGPGLIPENISEIIAADLRNSGKFTPLTAHNLPQNPVTTAEIIMDIWKNKNTYDIIVGQVQPGINNTYIVSYQLVNISGTSKTILIQNQFKVPRKWLRWSAHAISNESFETLTGIKGVFCTRIAYIAQFNSGMYPYELRIADYDGYNQIIVHRSKQPLMSPSWSPDGNKISYVTFESGKSALVIQTLDSGVIQQISNFPNHNGASAFSPDGRKLAFALSKTGSLNLYVLDLLSWHIHQITDSRSNNTEPSWFPDSQTLAYTSDQGGRPQIYKININEGRPQRLSWIGYQNQNADISSDGKFLVMVNTSNNSAQQHIAKLNLSTGDMQILTDTLLDETPTIAPNGVMVIYSASQGLRSVLQLVSIDGHFKTYLPTINGQSKFPSWSPYL